MISVLLATTGRPDMVEALVQNLADTTAGHDVELIAAVDVDPATQDVLARMIDVPLHTLVVDYRDEYRGCSRAWNDALALSKGDPVVLAADDLDFQPGWLDAALTTLAEFEDGWGFVGFNDGNSHGDWSTHYLVSRRLIVEVFGGVIAWEAYAHSFNDVEASERAKRAGRYARCEDAHVLHRHWLFGGRPQDETDTRNLVDHSASQQAYAARAGAGFPNDYPPVITS